MKKERKNSLINTVLIVFSDCSERLAVNARPLQWVHQECDDTRGKARLDGHGRAAQHPPELLPGSMIAGREEERQFYLGVQRF